MADTEKRKISAKIWRTVNDKLEEKMDAACLRRDAYLNRVLDIELGFLDDEVCFGNSEGAHKFIADRLDNIGERKLVSFALRPSLAERLNQICERKRIVRDAFMNRLLFLLVATPKIINRLFFYLADGDWEALVWNRCQREGLLTPKILYPFEQDFDPFWVIRTGIDLTTDEKDLIEYTDPDNGSVLRVQRYMGTEYVEPRKSLYATRFNNRQIKEIDLYGLNCYMPDWEIPGHEAELKMRQKFDEAFGEL